MFTIEQINKEIEELENNGTLSKDTCSQLCWLYVIRDNMQKQSKPKNINVPMLYSQLNSPIKRTNSIHEVEPLTIAEAEEWTSNMENEDGTVGPHWSFENAKEIMARKQISGSPIDFYCCLSMMYSDYCGVAKKFGVDTLDFYVSMAEAFINDKDAGGEDKVAAYYEFVAK